MSEIKDWKFTSIGVNKRWPDNFIDLTKNNKALEEYRSGKKDFIELRFNDAEFAMFCKLTTDALLNDKKACEIIDAAKKRLEDKEMDTYEKVGGFYHDDGGPIKTGYIPVEYNRYKKLIKMEEIFNSPDYIIIDKDIFDELKAKAKKYDEIKEVLS